MCNRLYISGHEIHHVVEKLRVFPVIQAETDVWPTAQAPIVVQRHDIPASIELMKWGLPAEWDNGKLLLFARMETAGQKQSFRRAYQDQRCLVLATGFWETRYFSRPGSDNEPLVFAGIYDTRHMGPIHREEGFTLLSAPATPEIEPYNDRMPFILPSEHWATWLDPQSRTHELSAVLQSPPPKLVASERSYTHPPRHQKLQSPMPPDPAEQMELQW